MAQEYCWGVSRWCVLEGGVPARFRPLIHDFERVARALPRFVAEAVLWQTNQNEQNAIAMFRFAATVDGSGVFDIPPDALRLYMAPTISRKFVRHGMTHPATEPLRVEDVYDALTAAPFAPKEAFCIVTALLGTSPEQAIFVHWNKEVRLKSFRFGTAVLEGGDSEAPAGEKAREVSHQKEMGQELVEASQHLNLLTQAAQQRPA